MGHSGLGFLRGQDLPPVVNPHGRPQFHARSGDAGSVLIHHPSRDGDLRLKAGAHKQKTQNGSRTVETPCHRGFVRAGYACLPTSIQRGSGAAPAH
jgi:hypothetical protein